MTNFSLFFFLLEKNLQVVWNGRDSITKCFKLIHFEKLCWKELLRVIVRLVKWFLSLVIKHWNGKRQIDKMWLKSLEAFKQLGLKELLVIIVNLTRDRISLMSGVFFSEQWGYWLYVSSKFSDDHFLESTLI